MTSILAPSQLNTAPVLPAKNPSHIGLESALLTVYPFISNQIHQSSDLLAGSIYDGLAKTKNLYQQARNAYEAALEWAFVQGKTPEYFRGGYNPCWRKFKATLTAVLYDNSSREQKLKNQAATKIQAAFRGYRIRKQLTEVENHCSICLDYINQIKEPAEKLPTSPYAAIKLECAFHTFHTSCAIEAIATSKANACTLCTQSPAIKKTVIASIYMNLINAFSSNKKLNAFYKREQKYSNFFQQVRTCIKNLSIDIVYEAVAQGNISFLNLIVTHPETSRRAQLVTLLKRIALCAAASESTAVLDWIVKQGDDGIKALLTAKDNNRQNIAHIAAASESTAVLEWIAQQEDPALQALLTAVDNNRQNTAHIIANGHIFVGEPEDQIEILEWIAEQEDPALQALLTAVDINRQNIAHIAAASESTAVLEWIAQQEHPALQALLTAVDNNGQNIAHIAEASGQTAVLEWIAQQEDPDQNFNIQTSITTLTAIAVAAASAMLFAAQWLYNSEE